MTLPEFSLRQTVLVNVLFFVCLIGGIAAFSRIPVEYHPDVALNSVGIATVWPGASAEEVERLVTQKLEEELSAVTDIDEMRSTSQADSSTILIDFDEMLDEAEYESAVNDVRAALDRVDDLPADAEEPYLYEIVATAPVESHDLEECIDASGELVARLQTQLAAEIAGRVLATRRKRAHLFDQAAKEFLPSRDGNDDGTPFGKRPDRFAADARGGAGDDDDAVAELHFHQVSGWVSGPTPSAHS